MRDVLYSSRENINFVHEVYRQAFLLNYSTIHQVEAMRTAICIYNEWLTTNSRKPPFLNEPEEELEIGSNSKQRLRADSYSGAMLATTGGNLAAGLQNILQIFMTNTVNVFMVQTAHMDIRFTSR